MGKTTINARSLARWRRNPAKFIEQCMVNPETGEKFVLLDAERRFLEHAFQTDSEGRLLYPEQCYSAPKKTGKTGFAAMHLLTTTLLYGGSYAEGYCVANDLEQSSTRVFQAVKRIVEKSPMLKREARIVSNKITFPATGAVITAISSDYASAAGANPTVSSFDELWGSTLERSNRLWDEMCPVPTRKISCRLVTTYAGFTGESKLLENLYKRGMEQPEIGPDLRAGNGQLFYWTHDFQAPWQTETWREQMRSQLRPHAFERMIENRFSSATESFIDMDAWDACCTGHQVAANTDLSAWAAVDASHKHDSTGITATTWDRGAKRCRLLHHRIFVPTKNHPIDFERGIEATILDLKRRYRLREVRYDPWGMQASAQRLRQQGVNMVEFVQSQSNLTASSQKLFELIRAGNLIAYPDPDLRLAIQRAVAVENPRGRRIAKEKTSHKIDVVVSLAMSCLAAVEKGELGRMRTGAIDFASTGRVFWHEEQRPPMRFETITEAEMIRLKEAGEW